MSNFHRYVQRALDLGAKETKMIQAQSIVTAEWVRVKCQFGCGGYGRALTCPPFSPTPELTRKIISFYTHALLLHGDEYTAVGSIVATLEREAFLDGFYKAFGMGSGPCTLCEKCPKQCRYPDRARPSMEACGIDVFSTVRINGFPIEVLRTTGCEANFYGVLLLE